MNKTYLVTIGKMRTYSQEYIYTTVVCTNLPELYKQLDGTHYISMVHALTKPEAEEFSE